MISMKESIQTIAVFAVGIFFIYRLLTGWMSANMDVAIDSSRFHLNDQEDYLAVDVKLERGEYGTLQLGDSQVRVTYLDSTAGPPPISLAGMQRLADKEGKLNWEKIAPEPHLNLHAKEKSEFAAALKVPRNAACIIEVTFLTHRRLDGLEWLGGFHWGQRRSSSVSLPFPQEATPTSSPKPQFP
jgi:hypothetical protein